MPLEDFFMDNMHLEDFLIFLLDNMHLGDFFILDNIGQYFFWTILDNMHLEDGAEDDDAVKLVESRVKVVWSERIHSDHLHIFVLVFVLVFV